MTMTTEKVMPRVLSVFLPTTRSVVCLSTDHGASFLEAADAA